MWTTLTRSATTKYLLFIAAACVAAWAMLCYAPRPRPAYAATMIAAENALLREWGCNLTFHEMERLLEEDVASVLADGPIPARRVRLDQVEAHLQAQAPPDSTCPKHVLALFYQPAAASWGAGGGTPLYTVTWTNPAPGPRPLLPPRMFHVPGRCRHARSPRPPSPPSTRRPPRARSGTPPPPRHPRNTLPRHLLSRQRHKRPPPGSGLPPPPVRRNLPHHLSQCRYHRLPPPPAEGEPRANHPRRKQFPLRDSNDRHQRCETDAPRPGRRHPRRQHMAPESHSLASHANSTARQPQLSS